MYFEIVFEVDMIYSEASLEDTIYCNNHGCTVLELSTTVLKVVHY